MSQQEHYETAPQDRIPLPQKIIYGAGAFVNNLLAAAIGGMAIILNLGLGMNPALVGLLGILDLPRAFVEQPELTRVPITFPKLDEAGRLRDAARHVEAESVALTATHQNGARVGACRIQRVIVPRRKTLENSRADHGPGAVEWLFNGPSNEIL